MTDAIESGPGPLKRDPPDAVPLDPSAVTRGAMREGVWPLTPDHWQVLSFVFTYYLEQGRIPIIVKIARGTGFRVKHLFALFPRGVIQTVCPMLGLPLPADLAGWHHPDADA